MGNSCKICNKTIHPRRVALGYTNTCPEHSTVTKCVGFTIADNDGTYIIDIVKDPQVAKDMERLRSTRGQ